MVIIYEEEDVPVIEIIEDDEIILPNLDALKKKKSKCVIPGCKNIGNYTHTFCRKHSAVYKLEKPEECPICMDSLDNEKYPLRASDDKNVCGHWVHHSCVISSGKQECPMCREKIKLNREEQKQLNNIKNKHKKEKEEEERREIQEALRVERTIISRNTRWIDSRRQRDMFNNSSRDVSRRIQQYIDSDERLATITQLQDMMTSTTRSLRDDATVLFELQSSLNRINESNITVSRNIHNTFFRLMGVVELQIRHLVSENLD